MVGAMLVDGLAQAASGPATLGPGTVPIQLMVNGVLIQAAVDPGTTLVELLRNRLELTGTKVGCDRGACSTCTVWLDGKVVASCMTLAMDVRGKAVTTRMGIGANRCLELCGQE